MSAALRYIFWGLVQAVVKLWYLNPVSLLLRRWRHLHHLNTRMALRIRPRLIDLARDFFLSDDRRKRQLLSWVKSILPWLEEDVFDFTACWQDGVVLCALMESISPGACPKFHLLKAHNRVNNCRLGLQLAMRYLHVTELPLSPEEMAIAEAESEVKICHLVQLLKWKYQKQGSKPTVFSSVNLEQPVESKCQARGTGLKAGIVGKRAKFNVVTERALHLDLLIEIRGPNNEYNKERIISLNTEVKFRFKDHVKAAVAPTSDEEGRTKIINDGAGHSFLRQKSLDEDQSHLVIPFDYQCVGEGRFLVTYIPRNAGLHYITILSGGVHVMGSPFEVKVSDWVSSWNLLPTSPMVPFDMLKPEEEKPQDMKKPSERIIRKLSHVAHVSKQLTRMKRRVLRKVITATGEAIICDATPTLSRQNSGELELSDKHRPGTDASMSTSGHVVRRKNKTNEMKNNQLPDPDINHETNHGSTSLSSSSSSLQKYRPGSAFLATVIAAQASMASRGEERKTPNSDDTNKETTKTEDSDVTLHKPEGNPLLEAGLNLITCSNKEMVSSRVVTTPNSEEDHDKMRLFGDGREDSSPEATGNTLLHDVPNDIVDSSILQTVTLSDTSHHSNYLDNIPDMETNEYSERVVSVTSDIGSYKTAQPLLGVNDVVSTLGDGTHQDGRDLPVSPSHRHYMSSFSVDGSHQHHVLGSANSCSKLLSVATSVRDSKEETRIHSFSRQQTLPVLEVSVTSCPDMSGDISLKNLQNSPAEGSPSFRNKPVTEKQAPGDAGSKSEDIAAECNTTDSGTRGHEDDEAFMSPTTTRGQRGQHDTCSPCGTCCTNQLSINKKDLDDRVYEIIEEISERDNDSSRQEEDSLETSVDTVANGDFKSNQVIADFTCQMPLSSQYGTFVDLSQEVNRWHPYHNSLSFDISDVRQKHKITWSHSKSFSEERRLQKSLSYPYRSQSLADKDWTDFTAISGPPTTASQRFHDTENELLSSDSENKNHSMDKVDNGDINRNQLYVNNSGTPLENKNSRSKNWSQARILSLVDDKSYTSDINWQDKSDSLAATRRWNTFDAATVTVKPSDVPGIDQLSQVQNGMLDTELDTDDDEILRIIVPNNSGRSSTVGSLKNERISLIPVSIATKIPDVCVYPSGSVEPFSTSERGSQLDVNTETPTGVLPGSPLSDLSNKSGNSDWSDNENSPSRFRTYRRSTRRRSSSKGDWSPQLVDLTYRGGIVVGREAYTHSEIGHSLNVPLENNRSLSESLAETVTKPTVEKKKILDSPRRKETISSSSAYMVAKKTQATQYEFPFVSVSATENARVDLVPKSSTETFLTEDSQASRALSDKQAGYCHSQDLGQRGTTGSFSHDTLPAKLGLTIQRRRKPVYKYDDSMTNYQVNSHHLPAVNGKYVVKKMILSEPGSDENNVSCTTLLPPSLAIADCLSFDNWTCNDNEEPTLNCNADNILSHGTADVSKHTVSSHLDYFMERPLTPTKYREEKDNTQRRLVESKIHCSETLANATLPAGIKIVQPIVGQERLESTAGEDHDDEILEFRLETDLGSVGVSIDAGDRILTPTKYRRSRCYNDDKRQPLTLITSTAGQLKRQTKQDDDTSTQDGQYNREGGRLCPTSHSQHGHEVQIPSRHHDSSIMPAKNATNPLTDSIWNPVDRELGEVYISHTLDNNSHNTSQSFCVNCSSSNKQLHSLNVDNHPGVRVACSDCPQSTLIPSDQAHHDYADNSYLRKRQKVIPEETWRDISNGRVKTPGLFDGHFPGSEESLVHISSFGNHMFHQQQLPLNQSSSQLFTPTPRGDQNHTQAEIPSRNQDSRYFNKQQHHPSHNQYHNRADPQQLTQYTYQPIQNLDTPDFYPTDVARDYQHVPGNLTGYLRQHQTVPGEWYTCSSQHRPVGHDLRGNNIPSSSDDWDYRRSQRAEGSKPQIHSSPDQDISAPPPYQLHRKPTPLRQLHRETSPLNQLQREPSPLNQLQREPSPLSQLQREPSSHNQLHRKPSLPDMRKKQVHQHMPTSYIYQPQEHQLQEHQEQQCQKDKHQDNHYQNSHHHTHQYQEHPYQELQHQEHQLQEHQEQQYQESKHQEHRYRNSHHHTHQYQEHPQQELQNKERQLTKYHHQEHEHQEIPHQERQHPHKERQRQKHQHKEHQHQERQHEEHQHHGYQRQEHLNQQHQHHEREYQGGQNHKHQPQKRQYQEHQYEGDHRQEHRYQKNEQKEHNNRKQPLQKQKRQVDQYQEHPHQQHQYQEQQYQEHQYQEQQYQEHLHDTHQHQEHQYREHQHREHQYQGHQHHKHQHQEHQYQKHQHQEHRHQEHEHQEHRRHQHQQNTHQINQQGEAENDRKQQQPHQHGKQQQPHQHGKQQQPHQHGKQQQQPHQHEKQEPGQHGKQKLLHQTGSGSHPLSEQQQLWRSIGEGCGGHREVVLVRQSTVDTPDSGITDDSLHYSMPLIYTDNTI